MATSTRDPYDVLGVPRDASAEDIRRAYRKLARRLHPDVSDDPDAEERFKAVSEAYDVLSDPERRARLDRAGRAWDDGPAGAWPGDDAAAGFGGIRVDVGDGDLGDVLSSLFGARHAGGHGGPAGFAVRGADHEAVLELTLEEAARGGRRHVTLADGRTFEVAVPAGVRDGQRIRVAGEGGGGRRGGPRGDLLLRVRLRPHPRLRLDGRDLHAELPVSPWEAALGATVEVPTLDGTTRIKVPAGSSSGRRLRVRGQGFPGPRGGRGDLYATVRIVVPRRLDPRERELLEELARTSRFDPRRPSR